MVDGSYLNMTLFYTAAAPLGNTAATQKGRLCRPQSVEKVAYATFSSISALACSFLTASQS